MATAGDLLQWHPHLHLITTDGGRGPDGAWRPLLEWDSVRLMTLFRKRLLARLVEQRAISKELVGKLLAWRHPGFSAHLGARCGQPMSIVAYVTDSFAIRRIHDHLGLSPPEPEKTPPVQEILRVAEPGEGWGVPADWQ